MAFALQNLFNAASRGLQRLKFNAWTLGHRGAEIFEKSAEALQLERMNPLRGIDEWRLGQIFDDARDGIYADLAWLYNEIEGIEPALVACCDMRESAAGECGWLVRTADADRTRGFDANLADEQRVALLEEFGAVEDDLADVAEHLVSAFFRGAAHALPLWNADGTLAGFRRLDLWNMAFDRQTGIWYWNADASRDEQTFQAIPPGEIVSLAVSGSRHVDHAALPIFIRAALGAKRYGVWLDRFGIPPVAVIMPPNAEKGEQANYMDLARKFSRGGNGILPNGSAVTYGTEARAVCPFLDFIRFQQQQIYTVGIGRVQSGDSQGANLGGNASGVVEDGFRRIVRRDARRTARAINDCATRKVIARLFPGRPVLAQFAWDTEVKRTSREVLEDAGLARTAGLAIDLDQVRELTGYKLEKAPESPSPAPGFAMNSQPKPETPFKNAAGGLQNAPRGADGQGDPSSKPPAQRAENGPSGATDILQAFAKDTGPAAEAVKELLAHPSKEAASDLMTRLPELLPTDPAMAAILADAMADAMAVAAAGEVMNTIDANGLAHDKLGRFGEDGGGAAAKDSPNKPAADKAGSPGDSGSSEEPAEAANYTPEHRAKVGQTGSWKSLGLPSLREIAPDEPRGEGKTKLADARKRIAEGETIKDPLGGSHEINARTTSHWTKKGKNIADVNERLALLDEAEDTISKPHEIWKGEKRKGTAFIRMVKTPDGKAVINVAEMKDGTVSWHGNEVAFDYWREGKLLYVR